MESNIRACAGSSAQSECSVCGESARQTNAQQTLSELKVVPESNVCLALLGNTIDTEVSARALYQISALPWLRCNILMDLRSRYRIVTSRLCGLDVSRQIAPESNSLRTAGLRWHNCSCLHMHIFCGRAPHLIYTKQSSGFTKISLPFVLWFLRSLSREQGFRMSVRGEQASV